MSSFKIGVRLVPIYHIEVDQLENEEDWEFVVERGRPHMHNDEICTECIVMAIF